MIAFSIVNFTISPNSSNHTLIDSAFVNMMPKPITNESTMAVIISQTGGILSVKNGANSFSESASAESSPGCSMCGKNSVAQPYEKSAPPTVEIYDTTITKISILPAPLPRLAIAGVTKPSTNKGTENFKSCANKTLKVLKMRMNTSGRNRPSTAPRAMAITTFGKSPSLIFFIVLFSLVSIAFISGK